nr:uncharacterized protein LOC109185201 [Ipomoea trifida]
MLHGQVATLLATWQQTFENQSVSLHDTPATVLVWVPTLLGKFKCNVDAALHNDVVHYGAIIRDSEGRFVAARSGHLLCDKDPYLAEALAVKEALTWLKERELSHVILESDCLNGVGVGEGGDGGRWLAFGDSRFDDDEFGDSWNGGDGRNGGDGWNGGDDWCSAVVTNGEGGGVYRD